MKYIVKIVTSIVKIREYWKLFQYRKSNNSKCIHNALDNFIFYFPLCWNGSCIIPPFELGLTKPVIKECSYKATWHRWSTNSERVNVLWTWTRSSGREIGRRPISTIGIGNHRNLLQNCWVEITQLEAVLFPPVAGELPSALLFDFQTETFGC